MYLSPSRSYSIWKSFFFNLKNALRLILIWLVSPACWNKSSMTCTAVSLFQSLLISKKRFCSPWICRFVVLNFERVWLHICSLLTSICRHAFVFICSKFVNFYFKKNLDIFSSYTFNGFFFHQIVEYCESDCDQHNKFYFFNVGRKDFINGVSSNFKRNWT